MQDPFDTIYISIVVCCRHVYQPRLLIFENDGRWATVYNVRRAVAHFALIGLILHVDGVHQR